MTIRKTNLIALVLVLLMVGAFFTSQTYALSTQKITSKASCTVYKGDSFNLNAKAKTKITYKSSDTGVAKVTSSGKVTAVADGKATITMKAAKSKKYKQAQRTITVTVKSRSVVIQADKEATGWEYLKDRSVSIWQKVNGKYAKIRTERIGSDGEVAIKGLPKDKLFWAETLQDRDGIKCIDDTEFPVKGYIKETYSTTKRLTSMHPLKISDSQTVVVKPNVGHILIKHDTSDYNVRLFDNSGEEVVFQTENPPEWMEEPNEVEDGHWLTDLEPGVYELVEEYNGDDDGKDKERREYVEVFPGQVNYVW